MKKLLFASGGIVVVILGTVFIVPSLIPSDVYKDKIQTQLTNELGRDVRISGDVKLSTFPLIKATTGAVEIDNPAGFSRTEFAQLKGLEARVKLLPLFSKRVEISRFTLEEPVIHLEKRADGTTNWTIGDETTPAPAEAVAGPFKRDGRMAALDPQIGAFNLENGTVTYKDAAAGTNIAVTNINTFVSMPSMSKTLVVDGSLTYDGTPLTLDMSLNSPRAFLDGQSAAIKGTAKTDFANIDIDGEFLPGEAIALAAKLDGSVTDMAAIKPYLGENAQYIDPLSSASLAGDIRYENNVISAKQANITAKGDGLDVNFTGDATLAETPQVTGQINAKLANMAAIKPFLTAETAKYITPLSAVNLSGNVNSNGTVHSISGSDIAITGKGLNAVYKGDARYDGAPTATGKLNLDISDMSVIKPYVPEGVNGLEHVKTLKLNAALKAKDKGFTAETLTANVTGPDLDGSFTGTASYTDIIKADGSFTANVANPAKLTASFAPDIKGAAALGATKASGKLALNDKDIWVQDLKLTTDGDNLKGSYDGNVIYRDGQPTAQGRFTADVADLPAIANLAELKIENIGAVKTVAASGTVNYAADKTSLSGVDAKLTNGALNGSYKGAATMGDVPAFDGEFTANIPQMAALNKAVTAEVPYADAIGKIDVSGQVKGSGKAIDITGLTATLSDGMMNGNYTGSARYNDGLNLNGKLDTTIPSLRDLAITTGTALPPSTSAGEIFGRVALSGDVSGTPERIDLKNANLSLDKMTGTGTFGIDMTPAKPMLTGTLNVAPGVDLRPYMASYSAQRPEGEIQPWSEEPINTEALKSIDANVKITTPYVKTGRMDLGATTIDTKLANGKLTADMPNLSLYGGVGSMTASLDASGNVPAIALDAKLDSLKTDSFLSAVAGFTKASGEGSTLLKIRGQGRSQAEIMKSLNGDGGYNVLDGTFQGINLTEFMTGLDSAFTARQLPGGIGANEVTKFQDLIGKFTVENGVVKVSNFNLKGFNVLAEGQGEVDLGNQSIDFRLRPKLTGEQASGLAAFGVPIRFSGGFGTAKASLDTDFLGQIVAAKAQAEVQKKLQEQVGGALGGLLGGGKPSTTTPSSGTTGSPSSETQTKPSEKDVIDDVIGGLFGSKKDAPKVDPAPETTDAAPQEGEKEEEAKQPTLEDALGGLFGKKKKKD